MPSARRRPAGARPAWERGARVKFHYTQPDFAELILAEQTYRVSAQPGRAGHGLTLGQLHLLSGASERQLRHWTDEDLIPAHRAGTHRRYYSAAVARALLLAQMTPQQVAALIALRRGGQSGRRLVVLIGSVMASVADNADVSEQERNGIRHGARSLVVHREAFTGKAAA